MLGRLCLPRSACHCHRHSAALLANSDVSSALWVAMCVAGPTSMAANRRIARLTSQLCPTTTRRPPAHCWLPGARLQPTSSCEEATSRPLDAIGDEGVAKLTIGVCHGVCSCLIAPLRPYPLSSDGVFRPLCLGPLVDPLDPLRRTAWCRCSGRSCRIFPRCFRSGAQMRCCRAWRSWTCCGARPSP